MAIDHAFTIAGHGTVVTGSVVSGATKTGDELEIVPGRIQFEFEVFRIMISRRLRFIVGSVRRSTWSGSITMRPDVGTNSFSE